MSTRPFVAYADMVGDLFHAGHVNVLRQVRALAEQRAGDGAEVRVVVGLLADDVAARYKRRPLLSLAERHAVVSACRYVDHVVAGSPLVTDDEFLDRHRIDLVVHGDDFDDASLDRYYAAARRRGILATVPYTRTGPAAPSTSVLLDRLRSRLAEEATAS